MLVYQRVSLSKMNDPGTTKRNGTPGSLRDRRDGAAGAATAKAPGGAEGAATETGEPPRKTRYSYIREIAR